MLSKYHSLDPLTDHIWRGEIMNTDTLVWKQHLLSLQNVKLLCTTLHTGRPHKSVVIRLMGGGRTKNKQQKQSSSSPICFQCSDCPLIFDFRRVIGSFHNSFSGKRWNFWRENSIWWSCFHRHWKCDPEHRILFVRVKKLKKKVRNGRLNL